MRLVPETRAIFPSLTVEQSLRVAGKGVFEKALELFPELNHLLKSRARHLSGGEQQMLVTATALAAEPKLLLADEISLGLAPIIVQRLLLALRDAATERGLGVLLVEQQVRAALKIADRAYVMKLGRIILEGTAESMAERTAEIEGAYLSGLESDAIFDLDPISPPTAEGAVTHGPVAFDGNGNV
jgi:branched-chain amino acid transport system ATP-binding protein